MWMCKFCWRRVLFVILAQFVHYRHNLKLLDKAPDLHCCRSRSIFPSRLFVGCFCIGLNNYNRKKSGFGWFSSLGPLRKQWFFMNGCFFSARSSFIVVADLGISKPHPLDGSNGLEKVGHESTQILRYLCDRVFYCLP